MLRCTYSKVTIEAKATRPENALGMDHIRIRNDIRLNTALIKKNSEKLRTTYHAVAVCCTVCGTINAIAHV